ncbi:MAG: alpha/beta fold hydrolase [Proteobacteria bacterium]|nr:alpha/beta fold hydrolase [Pseudomonadota bacterium]
MAANPSAPTRPAEQSGGQAAAFAEGLQQAFAAALKTAGEAQAVKLDPVRVAAIQARFAKEYVELWAGLLNGSVQSLEVKDRRFASESWRENRFSTYTAALYLLNARALLELVEAVQADAKTQQKVRFAVQQWVDAAAPSNIWALNPEAMQTAMKTHGESLRRGMDNLLADLRRGKLTQTDESEFEVGRNVATSEGAVVFENPWFQLIDYKPLAAQVHARPLLVVPPCINKFYILDLQPTNSLVRYALEQGQRVLLMSWRNPDATCAHWTWDDYIEHGVLRAIEVASEIAVAARPKPNKASKPPSQSSGKALSREDGAINALGFCVGGTLLGTALAVLAQRGSKPVHSATFLTTLLDFSDTGILDVFVDEAQVQMREATIGKGGLLRGAELAAAFSSLRPNDLTWNYVVGNYLKGETPPPFDLLYWNADSTNLPGPMLAWYLRNTYLENKLARPDAVTVAGKPLNLRRIAIPAYVYASREDHIVPWHSAYASALLLAGRTRFVLGASGHIAGVINPASKGKRSHWRLDAAARGRHVAGEASLPASADAWLESASEHPGSWWPDWAAWLAGQAGPLQAAPKAYGSAGYKPIEPAPGRYVKVRA